MHDHVKRDTVTHKGIEFAVTLRRDEEKALH